jgi:hypothetical protein
MVSVFINTRYFILARVEVIMSRIDFKKTKKLYIFLIFLMAFCLGSPISLFAADKDTPELDRFKLNLGAFIPFFNSELRVDSPTLGKGTIIDLEDRLGLDENITQFRADGYLRFFRRHRLQLGYYQLSRSASTQLTDPVQFGDTIFPAITVKTETDISVYEASYMFSFLQNENLEIAGTLGAQTIDIDASIAGGNGQYSESASVVGPLPVIGLDLIYKFTPDLHLTSRAQFFTFEIDKYDGTLIDFRAALEYRFYKYFGIGVGYNSFFVDLDIDGSKLLGKVDYRFQGVNIFGVVRF